MNIGWKLASLGISSLAGLAANQVVGAIWEKGFHKPKPAGDDSDLDIPLMEILVFTGVTTLVNTLVTELIKRKTLQWYEYK